MRTDVVDSSDASVYVIDRHRAEGCLVNLGHEPQPTGKVSFREKWEASSPGSRGEASAQLLPECSAVRDEVAASALSFYPAIGFGPGYVASQKRIGMELAQMRDLVNGTGLFQVDHDRSRQSRGTIGGQHHLEAGRLGRFLCAARDNRVAREQ